MARQFLAALLLAVLTVVGGVPAAAGDGHLTAVLAGPVPSAGGPAGTRPPAEYTDRTFHTGRSPRAGRTVPTDSSLRIERPVRTDRSLRIELPVRTDRSLRTDRPVRARPADRTLPFCRDIRPASTASTSRTAPRPTGVVTAAGVHGSGPATAPQPWAAAEHPRTPQHLPPPGPGSLPPLPPGIPPSHPVPGSASAAPARAAERFRAALPGVRGPPRAAVHRPGDPSQVPNPITGVPLPSS
ncbi:hypothetical protein [Streptomyces sp. NPDC059651]|uniref:hypothetical protein n=1 Tax=Streptomyces sp. NPDC059651 TaxID=3346897 RepID=UPI0036CB864A